MAHYAEVNHAGLVIRVVVTNDKDANEGQDWLRDTLGGTWIKTSYNTYKGVHYNPNTGKKSKDQAKALRKNYAGIGYTYDPDRDAFIPPQPGPEWILDESTCTWINPNPPEPDNVAAE